MRLLDERAQIKDAIESILVSTKNPFWGAAMWSKEVLKSNIEKTRSLDPNTTTRKEVSDIWGSEYYTRQMTCDECGTATYSMVALKSYNREYSKETEIYFCKDCLQKALELLK